MVNENIPCILELLPLKRQRPQPSGQLVSLLPTQSQQSPEAVFKLTKAPQEMRMALLPSDVEMLQTQQLWGQILL